MGTRSTIAFIERRKTAVSTQDVEYVRIYQQFDGYLEGVGIELAEWLSHKKIINGFGAGQTMEKGFCNGVGCMAAQFIHDFKTQIGNLYITTNVGFEDYNYKVIVEDDKITLEVYYWNDKLPLFTGTPKEFIEALNRGEIE